MKFTKRRAIASAIAAVVVGGSAALAVTLTSNNLQYIAGSQGKACSYTNPEYMITSGGSAVSYIHGSPRFNSTYSGVPYQTWEDPYITVGYNNSTSVAYECRNIPNSAAFPMPVKLGQQGTILGSTSDTTAPSFSGNASYDTWFEPSPLDNTYNQMAGQGNASTEVMIWMSHPTLDGFNPATAVTIDGYKWDVIVGTAASGHGQGAGHPAGWNVVNFLSPDVSNGSFEYLNLELNPFFSYAIAHHYLLPSDYLMAIDNGFEIRAGQASVNGYTLTGLK